jgi:hypothetical protein
LTFEIRGVKNGRGISTKDYCFFVHLVSLCCG